MTQRKHATTREKELRLAILRIERGLSSTSASKLSISAVARDVGVSAALVHNHYPAIVELIRSKRSSASLTQRDFKQDQLMAERQKSIILREELQVLRDQIAKLTTLNEMLLIENEELKAARRSGNVIGLHR